MIGPKATLRFYLDNAAEDWGLGEELRVHLAPFLGSNHLAESTDFEDADIHLLMLSPAYFAHAGHRDRLERALIWSDLGVTRAVPMMLRSSASLLLLAGERNILHSPKPIAELGGKPQRDRAWGAVVQEVWRILREWRPAPKPSRPAWPLSSAYNPIYFVSRTDYEQQIRAALDCPRPAFLYGPPRCGKSTLMAHLAAYLRSEASAYVVQAQSLADVEQAVHDIPIPSESRDGFFPHDQRLLVVMVDSLADEGQARDAMLLVDNAPEEVRNLIRLLIALPTDGWMGTAPLGQGLRIKELQSEESKELARRHGLNLDPIAHQALHQLVGGNPHLLHCVFRRHRLASVFSVREDEVMQACAPELKATLTWLTLHRLDGPVHRFLSAGKPLPAGAEVILRQHGLLGGRLGHPYLRYPIYERYLRSHLK